jgi:hypothetical protein
VRASPTVDEIGDALLALAHGQPIPIGPDDALQICKRSEEIRKHLSASSAQPSHYAAAAVTELEARRGTDAPVGALSASHEKA